MHMSPGEGCSGAWQPLKLIACPRLRGISAASALAAMLLSLPAGAQQTPSGSSQGPALQEIVVTGSLIKRTDTETPSPVQVISAADLVNSGYTNVSDVLRTLSANGAGTLSQGFGQAFATGGSGIALRGLTVGDTLTLVDGERMVDYPLSDDGERSFVDVSAIPFNAIDTVEVLKDGASAVYGADAIAGVVNIKLKKTYVGSEFTAEAGTSQHSDGTTEHLAGIFGWGDLTNDGYNMYAAIDWHHTDKILGSNRSGNWTNLDWTSLPGGQNTYGGTVPSVTGLVYPDSITGYVLNPTTPNAAGVYPNGMPGESFLPGCTAALQAANKCTFTFPGVIQPPTEQTNFLTKVTKALVNDWTFAVTASLFDSIAQQIAPPTEPAFGHLLNNTGASQGSIPLIAWGPGIPLHVNNYPALSLPANSSQNPYGQPATLVYSFPDVGPWVNDAETTTYRLFGDLKGTAGGWDLDASLGLMYAKMTEHFWGELDPTAAQAALNNGTYIPGATTNNPLQIAPETMATPSSTLDLLDLHGSRELFQMPGGPLELGVGAQYFHKAQNDTDPPSVTNGLQEGITNFTVGSQDATSGFVEVGGKPIKQLEVNAAVRYDHYDTYGGSATPKFGVKYTPVEMLSVRGTWGKGFRAPSISESGESGIAFGEGNGSDALLCANGYNAKGSYNAYCSYPVVGVEPPNPKLKAVTSTNATFGIIFEPLKEFNVSVDWYRIQLNNDIISSSSAGGLSNYTSVFRGKPEVLAVCTNTTTNGTPCTTAQVLTPAGIPIYTNFPYENAGITKTSGIDVDLRSKFDLGVVGSLTSDVNYTYISQYEIVVAGETFDVAGTHGPTSVSGDTGNPRQRAVASLTWDKGPATATLSVNYQSSFTITDPTAGSNSCLYALQSSGDGYGAAVSPALTTLPSAWYPYCAVHHFTDVNLYGRYQIGDHFEVHASIRNLFNAEPPVDLETYGGGALLRYTTLDQDGAVGRFFMAGGSVRF
jgi:iron complex outermembrane receptor protein